MRGRVAEALVERVVARQASKSLRFTEGAPVEIPRPPSEGIHLYIHVPFCMELCPYCSFHRFPFDGQAAVRYFAALRRELDLYARLGYSFSSVYVGGGTPTILMDELIATLECVHTLFGPSEISVETNPDRLDRETLGRLAACGVRRVSVGIQSFSDRILEAVGRLARYGSSEVLRRRVADASGVVETLNVDMMYDFPIQDERMLGKDLDVLLEIMPDQITYYPLMVSSQTRSRMERIMGSTTRKRSRLFHDLIADALEGRYVPNSAWCYSKGGAAMIDEYVVGGSEYAGAGCGALGFVGGTVYANTFSLERYIEALGAGASPVAHSRVFTTRELARYHLLMTLFGLRLDLSEFRRRLKRPWWSLVGPEILFFMLLGGLRSRGGRLELTRKGRYYWVVMMREFFTAVDNFRDQSRRASGVI